MKKYSMDWLQEEILILIISSLQLEEAARTSVLSRMWRHMWQYTYILDFDNPFYLRDSSSNIEKQSMKMRFIERVNLVLGLHRGSTILEFRVRFDMNEDNSDVINNWISFAFERHVERLVLDFGPCECKTRSRDYALRRQLFSNCNTSLTALHLIRVKVTAEDIELILSKFPLLQGLHLESIYSMVELKIVGSLPSLKRLVIKGCSSMRYLEVYAINLLCFTYQGPKIRVFFKVYPRLVEANIPGDVFLNVKHSQRTFFFDHDVSLNVKECQFSRRFSHLQSLVLDLRHLSLVFGLPELPKLCKLRKLEVWLDGNIFFHYFNCCAKLLEASPSLLRFGLKIYKLHGDRTSEHENVKVLELVGFLGMELDLLLAHSLLDKLPRIEKLYVDPRPICKDRELANWDISQSVAAAQHLKYSLRPNAELEITLPSP